MKWLQKLRGEEHANPVEDSYDEEPAVEPLPPPPAEWGPGQLVRETDGRIEVRCETRAEAKLAIREVKLKKKELQLARRDVVQEIRAVRADYRSSVAGRHSTVGLGRGTGGRLMRAGIQGKRRYERMAADNEVTELEARRNSFDDALLEVDGLILTLENYAAGQED